MVLLCIKRGDENQFLIETKLSQPIETVNEEVASIYNGRLKISRICSEMEDLSNHGISLPPNMVGLTDEQIEELHLKDEFSESCYPSGGFVMNKDPTGRRNGQQPLANMQQILKNAIAEAKNLVTKKLVGENKCLTHGDVQKALDILKGATRICYPMDIPSYDPIKMEFMNIEDLHGKQASLEVIEPSCCQLWFAGRLLLPGKLLKDFMGNNEKSKVIVKIARKQEGAPSRELPITEEQRKQMMLMAYRRQEELKKLEQDDDDIYLNSSWSDSNSMRKHVHGLENVKFKF
ncbi:cilia- and flagella-associated protein 298 [Culicoides brevitarsis]|uniref:cilia- and flagella-associated protein 298 n=1 Tax=Culicoides brevitarsis TaxID=469753 RepID=UPI00307B8DB9